MKIGLGCDHGGYNLKLEIKQYLESKGVECVDYGTNNAEESVDYPIYGQKVAEAVVAKDVDYGILCCGTGIGISLAANKVPGIRCAVVSDTFSAKMSKAHNNANMLSLGTGSFRGSPPPRWRGCGSGPSAPRTPWPADSSSGRCWADTPGSFP